MLIKCPLCQNILTSLLSSFKRSTESSVLLASINLSYFSESRTEKRHNLVQAQKQNYFYTLTFIILPFVNRGSGSFRKNDFNKLLITLMSLHFCKDLKNKQSCMAAGLTDDNMRQASCQSLTSSWMSMSAMPLVLSSSCMLEMAALFPGTL